MTTTRRLPCWPKIVRTAAAERTLPGTPLRIPGSLTSSAMLIADLRWDIGWDEIKCVERATEIAMVPTLVFHGLGDNPVPVEVARLFQAGTPDLVLMVEPPKAGHVNSWNIDPDGYEETLEMFPERAVS